jgi:hypothetical protein
VSESPPANEAPDPNVIRRNTSIAFAISFGLALLVYYPILTHMVKTWKVNPHNYNGFF